jgi:hypothetical protein
MGKNIRQKGSVEMISRLALGERKMSIFLANLLQKNKHTVTFKGKN